MAIYGYMAIYSQLYLDVHLHGVIYLHTLAQCNDELLTEIYFSTTHKLHMSNRHIQKLFFFEKHTEKLLFWTTMAKWYLFQLFTLFKTYYYCQELVETF
jgi:hypothetical protein